MTDAFPEEAENGDFALEVTNAVGLEAELEDSALLKRLMAREPHFTESSFAELSFQGPLCVGHDLLDRGPPAKHSFVVRGDMAECLGRVLRTGKAGGIPVTNFANFERFIDAFESILTVIKPGE